MKKLKMRHVVIMQFFCSNYFQNDLILPHCNSVRTIQKHTAITRELWPYALDPHSTGLRTISRENKI